MYLTESERWIIIGALKDARRAWLDAGLTCANAGDPHLDEGFREQAEKATRLADLFEQAESIHIPHIKRYTWGKGGDHAKR